MAFLPGKFARFTAGGVTASGTFKWDVGFRRDRLDTTHFESTVSASGNNVHSEGLTGVLDTTFSVSGHVSDTLVNILFPEASIAATLLYRRNVSLGYSVASADVLSFSPSTSARGKAEFSAELQANGLVSPAA